MMTIRNLLCVLLCGALLLSATACAKPQSKEAPSQTQSESAPENDIEAQPAPIPKPEVQPSNPEVEEDLSYKTFQREWRGFADGCMLLIAIEQIDSFYNMSGSISITEIKSDKFVEFDFSVSPDGEGNFYVPLQNGFDLWFYIFSDVQLNATLIGGDESVQFILY